MSECPACCLAGEHGLPDFIVPLANETSVVPDAVVLQANETDGLGDLISRKKRKAEKRTGRTKRESSGNFGKRFKKESGKTDEVRFGF